MPPTTGWPVAAIYFANATGFLVSAAYFAPRFRQLRVVTGVEAIRQRFGATSEQVFTWLQIPLGTLQAGIWLNALGVFFSAIFGFDLVLTIVATGLIVVFMALIGGVLGHQVGGGSGKDIATVGGAVAGGVIGSNVGRDNTAQYGSRDVRRCENTTNATPAYWDVTYNFRGQDHQIQMTAPPGTTIAVNRDGVPRQ